MRIGPRKWMPGQAQHEADERSASTLLVTRRSPLVHQRNFFRRLLAAANALRNADAFISVAG
jgi:hypothetical protein